MRPLMKWGLIAGTLLLVLLLVSSAGIWLLLSSLREHQTVQMALQEIRDDPASVEQLGEPIAAGLWMSGQINVNDASGHASFSLNVLGSRREGRMYVEADKRLGEWRLQALVLDIGGQRHVLIEPKDAPHGGKLAKPQGSSQAVL